MSHPVNRLDRFQKGTYKAKKRISSFFIHLEKKDRISYTEKCIPHYRNITTKCSAARCCGNRRRYFNELTMQELRYRQEDMYFSEEV